MSEQKEGHQVRQQVCPARKEGHGAIDLDSELLHKQTAICPHCDTTCFRQKRVRDSYFCVRCDFSWSTKEVIDGREVEDE